MTDRRYVLDDGCCRHGPLIDLDRIRAEALAIGAKSERERLRARAEALDSWYDDWPEDIDLSGTLHHFAAALLAEPEETP